MSEHSAEKDAQYHRHRSGEVVQGPAARCIDPGAGAHDVLVLSGDALQRALYEVDSVHHFHEDACLCGFASSRSRSRTEHITTEVMVALASHTCVTPPG